MKLLCIGDVALIDKPGDNRSWEPPIGVIPGADERILFNFELPFGRQVNPTPRVRGPRLIANPETISLIHQWSPGIAALATNHVLDAGEEGLVGTIKVLQGEGFVTFGAGTTREEISIPLIWETGEGRLGIINWVFPETHPDRDQAPGPNCWPGLERGCQAVRELKAMVDWVLIFPHWSDELFTYPTLEDRKIARALINAGADIIVGHHPHVVRGFETIAGKPVFYSVGNFFFADIHDHQKGTVSRPARRNREALAVRLHFRRGQKVLVETLSFWNADGFTKPDRTNRAVRRMKAASAALSRVPIEQYAAWYLERRKLFNRFEYRIHFSLVKLGWGGLFRYAFARLLQLFGPDSSKPKTSQPKG